ncbi:hypothetical protein ACHAWF_018471 [Thalassiosira exigua]
MDERQTHQTPTTLRRRLNPFLRKPLHVVLEEDCQHQFSAIDSAPAGDAAGADASSAARDRHEHETSGDGGGGIELPRRDRGDQREEFAFEYGDGDSDRHRRDHRRSPLSSEEPHRRRPSHAHHALPPRHLSLFDLVSIGVGGTIGSGVFVLNGLIARSYAGPATFVSWIVSGVAALLSGCCYAELSGRIPSAGSSYAYAFVALGELPAFVTAGMLTLEFLLSGSAVARSWGDKVVEWARVELHASDKVLRLLDPGYNVNPMACLVSIATTALVMAGVKESKMVTDCFTWMKVFLVVFMTVGGFLLFDASNFKPFVPPEFGTSGVLRGSVSSFFGYLGFDAVCCVAGEAKNAERNLPLSIMITLSIVTTLYIAAAIALVGMQPYTDISEESPFPEAFYANGVEWAAQLTAFGEVFTLPVVVLISVVIQPRLQYALANDGLLPQMFCEIDSTGNPKKGALFAGACMTIFATFIPFADLGDFVSTGGDMGLHVFSQRKDPSSEILIAFTVTNCSLVLMRRQSPDSSPSLLPRLLAGFNIFAFLTCMVISHGLQSPAGWILAALLSSVTITIATKISWQCPPTSSFGGSSGNSGSKSAQIYGEKNYFSTPLVPYIPCLGMFANYFLISRLSFFGIALLAIYTLGEQSVNENIDFVAPFAGTHHSTCQWMCFLSCSDFLFPIWSPALCREDRGLGSTVFHC